jgi:hypothetical protein
MPEDLLVVCIGERRHSWRETQGMDRQSPLPKIRNYLLRLPLVSTTNDAAEPPDQWWKWFQDKAAVQAQ